MNDTITSPLALAEDTICATATGTGGAIAIVRISGRQTFSIIDSVFRSRSFSAALADRRSLHYGTIVAADAADDTIDEVLLSAFRAPHSYTGEDSAEISCHASQYIIRRILEALLAQGCRMARPGEFTQRAFLNGKLDLSQAEAVADLIAATNKATHRLAMSQLRGGISGELSQLREQLLRLTSLLELELDFSDHEDLEFADRSELLALAQTIEAHIARLARSFETGQALKQGIPVAIVGKTNVGKSTLLNRLLNEERAIVSDVHGTTRDTIEDTIDIRGVQFRFIDTAGIRQTTDQVEQIGIRRTYQAIEKARVVLWLLDEEPSREEQQEMAGRCKEKALIPVINKADTLPPAFVPSADVLQQPPLLISAKTGQGIDDLDDAIFAAAGIPELNDDDIVVASARHYDILQRAHDSILRVLDGMGGDDSSPFAPHPSLPPDLLAEDLRQTIDILAEITGGQITPQETLQNIFSHFCVGK